MFSTVSGFNLSDADGNSRAAVRDAEEKYGSGSGSRGANRVIGLDDIFPGSAQRDVERAEMSNVITDQRKRLKQKDEEITKLQEQHGQLGQEHKKLAAEFAERTRVCDGIEGTLRGDEKQREALLLSIDKGFKETFEQLDRLTKEKKEVDQQLTKAKQELIKATGDATRLKTALRDTTRQLDEKNQEIKDAQKAHEEAMQKARGEIDQLAQEKKNLEEKVTALEKELAELRQQIAEKDTAIAKLQKELEDAKTEIANKKAELDVLTRSNTELSSSVAQWKANLEKCEGEKKDLVDQLGQVTTRLAELKERGKKNGEEIATKIAIERNLVSQLQDKLRKERAATVGLQQMVVKRYKDDDDSKGGAAASVSVQALQKEIDAHNKTITELEEKFQSEREMWASLDRIAEAKKQHLEQRLVEATNSAEAYKQRLQIAEEELKKERSANEDLARRTAERVREIEVLKKQVEGLKNQETKETEQLAALRKSEDALKKSIDVLEAGKQDQDKRIVELETALKGQAGEIAQAKREKETLAQKLEEQKALIARWELAAKGLVDAPDAPAPEPEKLQEVVKELIARRLSEKEVEMKNIVDGLKAKFTNERDALAKELETQNEQKSVNLAEIKRLTEQLAETGDRLKKADQDLKSEQLNRAVIQEKLIASLQTIDQLRKDYEQLQVQVQNASAAALQAEAKLEELKKLVVAAGAKVPELQNIKDVQAVLNALPALVISERAGKVNELGALEAKHRQELENLRTEFVAKYDQAVAKIEEQQQQQQKTQQAEVADLKQQLQQQQQQQRQQDEAAALQRQYSARVAELESKFNEQVQSIKTQYEEKARELQTVLNEKEALAGQIRGLEQKMQSVSVEKDNAERELRTRSTELETERSKRQTEKSKYDNEIKELTESLSEARKQYNTSVEQSRALIEFLNQELELNLEKGDNVLGAARKRLEQMDADRQNLANERQFFVGLVNQVFGTSIKPFQIGEDEETWKSRTQEQLQASFGLDTLRGLVREFDAKIVQQLGANGGEETRQRFEAEIKAAGTLKDLKDLVVSRSADLARLSDVVFGDNKQLRQDIEAVRKRMEEQLSTNLTLNAQVLPLRNEVKQLQAKQKQIEEKLRAMQKKLRVSRDENSTLQQSVGFVPGPGPTVIGKLQRTGGSTQDNRRTNLTGARSGSMDLGPPSIFAAPAPTNVAQGILWDVRDIVPEAFAPRTLQPERQVYQPVSQPRPQPQSQVQVTGQTPVKRPNTGTGFSFADYLKDAPLDAFTNEESIENRQKPIIDASRSEFDGYVRQFRTVSAQIANLPTPSDGKKAQELASAKQLATKVDQSIAEKEQKQVYTLTQEDKRQMFELNAMLASFGLPAQPIPDQIEVPSLPRTNAPKPKPKPEQKTGPGPESKSPVSESPTSIFDDDTAPMSPVVEETKTTQEFFKTDPKLSFGGLGPLKQMGKGQVPAASRVEFPSSSGSALGDKNTVFQQQQGRPSDTRRFFTQ